MAYYIQPISASTSIHVGTLPVSALAPAPTALLCTCCGSRHCSVTCHRAHYMQFNCHVWWCPNRPAVPDLSVPNAGNPSAGAVTPPPTPAPAPTPAPEMRRPCPDHPRLEYGRPRVMENTNQQRQPINRPLTPLHRRQIGRPITRAPSPAINTTMGAKG